MWEQFIYCLLFCGLTFTKKTKTTSFGNLNLKQLEDMNNCDVTAYMSGKRNSQGEKSDPDGSVYIKIFSLIPQSCSFFYKQHVYKVVKTVTKFRKYKMGQVKNKVVFLQMAAEPMGGGGGAQCFYELPHVVCYVK